MKRALAKDGFLQVKNTFKRFVSILLMALLGVGFFAGLKASSPDMQKTVDMYFDKHHVFDVEVLSTLGLSEKDIEELNNVEGCEVLPTYSTDAEFIVGETSIITKVYAYHDTQINGFELLEGRLPTGEKECVVEEAFLQMSELAIGDTITANGLEEDSVLKDDTFTIVGTISSPLYMSKERGTSKLGSGMIDCYMYVNENSFDAEVYTEAYLVFADAMQENTFGNGYEEKIDEVITTLEKVAEIREEERYQEIKDEATEVLTEKQKQLEDAKAEAESQITEAENEIAEGESKITSAENEIQKEERNANAEFSKAETEIAEAENTLAEKQAEFENSKTTIEAQINQAEAGLEQLNTSLKQTQAAIEQLEAEYEGVTDPEQLQEKEIKLETLVQTKQTIEAQKAEVQAQIKEANQGLEQAEAQIQSARAQIEQNKKTLEDAKQAAKKEIAAARNEIAVNKKKIEEAKVTLAEEKAKAEEKIADAEAKLADAQAEIDDIKKPEWYILDRTSNIGYNSYSQDTERIDNIAKVFPIVFFVVATLISLNSMTRMVEEQRVQIGTLKALGYHNGQIAAKYILYATLATVIGGVIGMLIGFNLIPNIVFSMYEMMYDLKDTQIEFNVYYAAIGLGIALVCIVGATIISCRKELKQMPAELMRPKAPKPGKRVFLEKIPLIWNHLNFTKKVTARNIFRYKKRFLMTIIGICGCTALVLAGFGLRNSISSMIPLQYGEIYRYTMQVSIKDGADASKLSQEIKQISEVEDQISVNMQAGKTQKDGKQEDIQLIIPEDAAKLTEFITIRNRKEPLAIEENAVILTEKLAKLLECEVGDTVILENSDNIQAEVRVSGITENYIYHYAYLSKDTYQTLYGELANNNVIFLKASTEEAVEEALAAKLLTYTDSVSGVSKNSTAMHMMDDTMKSLDSVVWILIISAGLLALVVLYNLSNVNISERIRELATIKVLGFYDREVYDYVSKETMILTIIGIIIGLVAGYFLNLFVIETCELDVIVFNKIVEPVSYLYAAAITGGFAIIVNITTYFRLKKINMIESLKSVE